MESLWKSHFPFLTNRLFPGAATVLAFGENKEIIQIYKNKDINKIPEDIVHQVLEDCIS